MVLISEENPSQVVPHGGFVEEQEVHMDVSQDLTYENEDASDVDVYDIDPEMVPSPNGSRYWVPNVPVHEKPKIHDIFNTFDEAYNMYKEYAAKARFGVKKSGIKYNKEGVMTHRYVWCNKSGKSRKKNEVNTLIEDVVPEDNKGEGDGGKRKRTRKSSTTLTDCKARIGLRPIEGTSSFKIYDFVENHNHPLIDPANMDLSRARRQLEFGEYIFIHRASLTNIGPQKAHRLRVALLGGFDKVRGMSIDWNNFRRGLNLFIGERDAQMLVDKMLKRQEHVPEFSFYHHTIEGGKELCRMFWADETMKCNYVSFGDIVSFDATFDTNKYDMVFVPFTGIDHHQKTVTFGAALLLDEKADSYIWMLQSFLKVHGKQPTLAVTDQDGAIRKAILKVFPESHHRLCMWHITQKLPAKVLGDVDADSDFRKEFHKLVWNVYLTPEKFEDRWKDLILKFNLSENKWLSEMYAIRERWVPGYFSELPLCGLMKTTSRSESTNAFFQVYSHHGNSLVHFMLCFESAMEKQRYIQRVLDNTNAEKSPVMLTQLPIERHALDVYTHSIFRDVQDEIYKGLYACSQTSSRSEGDVEHCVIHQRDKSKNTVIFATVSQNRLDGSVICSCGHFNRHGFLCRHVLCVFRIIGQDTIPHNYILRRWTKNPLPAHLRDKKHRYGPCIEEGERLASDIYSTIEDCINLIRTDTDKLVVLLTKLKDLKKEIEEDSPPLNTHQNKDALYEELLGVKAPIVLDVLNPQEKCPNKGHRRFKSAAEKGKAVKKAKTYIKVPFKRRTCKNCGILGHNIRGCKEPCGFCGQAGYTKVTCNNKQSTSKQQLFDEDEDDNEEEKNIAEEDAIAVEAMEDETEDETDNDEDDEDEDY